MTRSSAGVVSRSCGLPSLDERVPAEGCRDYSGTTVCRCSTDGCNAYPNVTSASASVWTCLSCVNCGGERGRVVDCSRTSRSRTCHLVRTPSGQVSRSCGAAGLDRLITEGCTTTYGYTVCKCSGNNCNAYPRLTGQTSETTTPALVSAIPVSTTIAPPSQVTTTQAATWTCYVCVNCGRSVGTSVDCSRISSSRTCYLVQNPRGTVTRSCGLSEFDNMRNYDGCETVNGYTICRCSSNGCNSYRNITDTRRGSALTTPATPGSSTPATASSSTPATWSCYTCLDCGRSLGIVVQCSIFSPSRTCYFTRQPSGKVSRSCGLPDVDRLVAEDGCTTDQNHTLCRCSEDRCNSYSADVTAPRRPNYSTPPAGNPVPRFQCHSCTDCESSTGPLIDCSLISTSGTCYTARDPRGTISRSCGVPQLDQVMTMDGCRRRNNVELCRCSQSACNTQQI